MSLKGLAIFSVGLLFLSSGCVVLFPFYGIKSPRNEPREYQKQYLSDLGLDTFHVYSIRSSCIDSLSEPKYLLNEYKIKTGAKASVVQIRMYDRNGIFQYGWEQCFGNLKHFDLFKTIPISSKYQHLPVNMNLTFMTDLELFDLTDMQREALLSEILNYDYIIAVFWASWAGYFSKNTLKQVCEYVNNSGPSRILFIKLNTSSNQTYKP
jgi:hypothetical protein